MSRSMLIVGGSRGLGLEISRHFADKVERLWCVSRTCSPFGEWIPADLTSPNGFTAISEKLRDLPIDTLIYAGGTWETDAFTDAYDFLTGPEDDIDRVLAVNLAGPIKLIRLLTPHLTRSIAPRFIAIGARSGLDNCATREVANSASKYGLRGMAHALRAELPRIAVTVINPGNIATSEVLDDIAAGRFADQAPIPVADLLKVIDCALTLSFDSVMSEVSLAQRQNHKSEQSS
jgi:3-oxoacyl-[acyl-carrier protein] reductase